MVEHSKKFEMVKEWWELHKPISWIKNAVKKRFITAEEYLEITGQEYEA